MGDSDVDDIFEDFGDKVEDKPKSDKGEHSEKKLSEEELLKAKYQKAEHDLKEKHKKENELLEEKRKNELRGHGETPSKGFPNVEKIGYIAIILVLAVYIVIDVSFNHLGGSMDVEADQTITAAVDVEDKIEEIVEEEAAEEEIVEEEPELSGVITLDIDNIYTEVPDEDEDFGYLSKVVFTINNGKDKVLIPYLEVFAYDSENQDPYETRSRGHYTYVIGINPGDNHTGTIDLVPTTWTHLDLKKHIRLVLNSTEDGYITSWNEEVLIE